MKKIKTVFLGCLIIGTSLSAMNMCGLKDIQINKKVPNTKWTKANQKVGDLEFKTFKEVLKNEECIIYVDKKTNLIKKIKRNVKTKYPTRPPATLDNVNFKIGELVYKKDKSIETVKKEFTDLKVFYKQLNKHRYTTKYYKSIYSDDKKSIVIFSICKKPGEQCKTIFTEQDKDLDNKIYRTDSRRLLNSVVKRQNLELLRTSKPF
jgi:hypothetical protein